jgi:hypothetical protein
MYDEEYEDYMSLVEEASCESAHPWKDEDWEPRAVANAKAYAAKHHYSWPPGLNDFDHRWEEEHN